MTRVATNVLATIALVLGLAGASYGAFKLPRNSVRSPSIVDGQVKSADLARDAVTASGVAAGAIGPGAFRQGDLPGGPGGARGADGASGPAGEAGARGSATVRYRLVAPVTVVAGGDKPIPLVPDPSWTQAAGETDVLAFRVHASPIGPACSGTQIQLNAGTKAVAFIPVVQQATFGDLLTGFVAPAAAIPRTLTATVIDSCLSTSFVIDAVDIDLVRAS
jgi:hypothetical protein